MRRGSAGQPSAASLLPTAVVAAAVPVLALVVSGVLWRSATGTIVVQRMRITATTTQNGTTRHAQPFWVTAITETPTGTSDGEPQRSLASNSITRPGFQQAKAGGSLELYDPLDDTIYVTTERAVRRALLAGRRIAVGSGQSLAGSAGRTQVVSAASVGYPVASPGPPGQWLRSGWYRQSGRVRIDGRAALRLVQAQPTGQLTLRPHGFSSRTTVYVVPGDLHPIETVNSTRLPGVRVISTTRWLLYRVLPATTANEGLLSLAARHPYARLVRGAHAYLRASQSEVRTDVVRSG